MLRKVLSYAAFSLLIFAAAQPAAALSTLQELVDNAYTGEVIQVFPGDYSGPGNFNVDFKGKELTLEAAIPSNPPRLMCSPGQHGFIFTSNEGSGSKVIGFEIHGAQVMNNNPGDHNADGGGVLIVNSSPVIQDCAFVTCTAKFGGGVAIFEDASPQIINCTFIDCDASLAGGSVYVGSSNTVTFSKNIIANSVGGYGVFASPASTINFSCCCFWNNAPGNTSGPCSLDSNTIFQDPLFCDESSLDFSIASISPCAPSYSPCGELIGAKPVGCLGYLPGDADSSGAVTHLDDIYLINFKYKGGPAPRPLHAGDPNGDCTINILDVVYLINYLYKGGSAPLPACGGEGTPTFKVGPTAAAPTASLFARYESEGDKTVIAIESPFDLYAVEFEAVGEKDLAATSLVEGLQLFAGHSDGVTRIGILDAKGQGYIAAGSTPVVEIEGRVGTVSALGVDANGKVVMISAGLGGDFLLPAEFSLSQNYPNPFNPVTNFTFALPVASDVKLEVFNLLGQVVTTLVDGRVEAGRHTVTWNGEKQASGVYLYRLTTDEFTETKKMVLLK